MREGLPIVAEIAGRRVPRAEVQAWEATRAAKVCRKLEIEPSEDLDARREALVRRKLELGHDTVERMLARELRLSARSSRVMTALSWGKPRLCTVELSCAQGSAELVPAFYKSAMETGDEGALLIASPDHYLLSRGDDGVQQVIETTGGSPLASRIFLDEGDLATVTTQADPDFPVQWVAVGRVAAEGPPAGALRHEFRDEPEGFRARLTIEFPTLTPPHLVKAHRMHLACEFSNWIEAANAATG